MKFLSILILLVFFLAIFFGKRAYKTNSSKFDQAPRFGFSTSVFILMLRLVRGALALAFVLVGLFACRVLLREFKLMDTHGGLRNSFEFGGLIGFSIVLSGFLIALFLIYRVSGRLRTKVNQLHSARGSPDAPLIKTHWSL